MSSSLIRAAAASITAAGLLWALSGCSSGPSSTAKPTSTPTGRKTGVSGADPVGQALTAQTVEYQTAVLTQQVAQVERAFAKTMADRDFNAFVNFVSPEAAFFSGGLVSHGRAEIAAQWQPYFTAKKAPFSWEPDHVEVLPSGKLALSTGPVYQGSTLIGRFNSVWRLDAPNSWHIVFDKGEAICANPAQH